MLLRYLFLFLLGVCSTIHTSGQITIINPVDQEVMDADFVEFLWSDNDPGNFELEISTNASFTPLLSRDTIFGAASLLKQNLNPGNYYWRIRNISLNNTTWSNVYSFELIDLASYTSLFFWLKPESGFQLTGSSKITQWTNGIGTNHATQPSAASQPTLIPQGINGFDLVSFDGINDHLNFNAETDIMEAFIVCKHNTGSQNYAPVLGDGLQQPDFHGGLNNRLFISPFTSPNIRNGSLLVNGVSTPILTATKPTSFTSLSISAVDSTQASTIARDRGFTARSWNGSYAEVILFNESLSTADKTKIDKYLKWKYTDFPFLGKDTLVCGESLDLFVPKNNAYSSISWSTSASNVDTLTVTQNGTYWVSIVSFGISLTDTIVVSGIVPKPQMSVNTNQTICYGDSLTVSYTPLSGYTHFWSNGDSSVTTSFKDSSQVMQVFHVDANGCLASSESFDLFVDSLSLQSTLGPDRNLCLGSTIELETSAIGPFEYLWSTGDTSATTSAQVFGVQSIWLSLSNVNNCVFTDTIEVDSLNLPAPAVNFIADTVCLFDTASLFDISIPGAGDSVISWEWVFESGDTLLNQNPSYAFTTYNEQVRLTITTDSSCENSIVKTIYNHRLPESSFLDFVECAQSEFNLQSNSTITLPDNIVAHTWHVNGQVLTGSSPNFTFPNAGFFDVKLTVETNNGCLDSITRPVEVFPALFPNFEIEKICIGDTTQFIETTPSFSVVSREWDFGLFNQSSTAQNPTFYYPNTGTYTVSLSVENAIGCFSEISQTIEIRDLPTVNFFSDNTCEKATSTFIDVSSTANGTIVNQLWEIDGNTLFGDTVNFVFDEANTYPVSLLVEDNFGCLNDSSGQVEIFASPTVNFTFSPNYGEAPIDISFSNLSSSNTVDYFWDFGDGTGSSIDANPSHTYNTNGNYSILLAGSTLQGCSDSLYRDIAIIPTELDLELSNFSIQQITLPDGSTAYQPSVVLKNVGTRAVFNAELLLQVNNETSIAESWEGILQVGESRFYELENYAVIHRADFLDYICLEAALVNDNTELNLVNNKACAIQRGVIQCSPIYPNPTTNIAHIDVITETDGIAIIEVFDLSGKMIIQNNSVELAEGYNLVSMHTHMLQAGKYVVNLNYQEDVTSFSLIITNP